MRLTAFAAPAGLSDLDPIPDQREAWSATISNIIDHVIGQKNATQFYNPTGPGGADASDETARDLLWTAFPQRLAYRVGITQALADADELYEDLTLGFTRAGAPVALPVRRQTEYCEWRVIRDGEGRISRVLFTTEVLEYWWAFAQGYPPTEYGGPTARGPARGDLARVLAHYHDLVSPDVRPEDLVFAEDILDAKGVVTFAAGSYNPWNRWNTTHGLVHMSAQDNCLCAMLNQCAGTSKGRQPADGGELSEPTRFLGALHPDRGGKGVNDAADIAIAGVVGSLARARSMITARDPVAIVMRQLDTRGWKLPGDGDPGKLWKVLRGTPGGALRAECSPPEGASYTLSDVEIFGKPLRHGGQIAQCLTVAFPLTAMTFGAMPHEIHPPEGQALKLAAGSSPMLVSEADTVTPTPLFTPAFPASQPQLDEPVLDDREIQGNSLAGFNKNHQWFIGFDIVDAALARPWLQAQADQLSSLADVAAHNEAYRAYKERDATRPAATSWYNLALSAAGLRALGHSDVDKLASLAFRQGMSQRGLFGISAAEPHILVILGADEEHLLHKLLGTPAQIAQQADSWGLRVAFHHVGENIDDKDRLGFKDGISQPGIRGLLSAPSHPPLTPREMAPPADPNDIEYARPGRALIWPGEIVLGYQRQDMRHPRTPAPALPCDPAWSRNGSYLAFMRFRHDIDAFNATCAARATAEVPAEVVAARLVGRWPSGSPLELHPTSDGGVVSDDFGYDADPRGERCPFTAHIRKVHPRDETTDDGGPTSTLRRRLLRRGISFGAKDRGERGLLFVSYQASFEDQLEPVFGAWLKDGVRPVGPDNAPDALLSLSELLEGGYFFSPAISAVRLLAS